MTESVDNSFSRDGGRLGGGDSSSEQSDALELPEDGNAEIDLDQLASKVEQSKQQLNNEMKQRYGGKFCANSDLPPY